MPGPYLDHTRLRRMNRAALPLAALLLLAAPVALAQDVPRGARLSYTRGPGTEGCLEEPSLRRVVASQLGGVDPFVPDGAWLIEVDVRRKGRAFEGEITLHDREGRKLGREQLSSPNCVVLVQDIGLSLSILMRPFLPLRPAPGTGSAPTSPSARPPPGDTAPPVSPDAPPKAPASKPPCQVAAPVGPVLSPRLSPARPHLQVGAGVVLAAGVAPAMTVGFSGFSGVRWERFSVSLEARGDLPIDAEPYRDWTIGVWGVNGSLVPCGHADWFFGCALATAGTVWHVRDSTIREVALPYAGFGFRAGLEVSFSARLAGQLTGDLLIHTRRPFFRPIHGAGWSVAPVSQAMALRLVAVF